ncbi:hypothetical protein GCM10010423_14560 [Streptomyces levis]|uniref:Uncharacterized protein n=1 Tax=Streptomyces levis TaxID=285566 RepID=A0ABP6AT63_9ACTN
MSRGLLPIGAGDAGSPAGTSRPYDMAARGNGPRATAVRRPVEAGSRNGAQITGGAGHDDPGRGSDLYRAHPEGRCIEPDESGWSSAIGSGRGGGHRSPG